MAAINFPAAVGKRLALLEDIQVLRALGLRSLKHVLESGVLPIRVEGGDDLGTVSTSLTTSCIVWAASCRKEIQITQPGPDFNKYEAQAAEGKLSLESETFGKNNVITASFLLLALVAGGRAESLLVDATAQMICDWVFKKGDKERPISAYPVFQSCEGLRAYERLLRVSAEQKQKIKETLKQCGEWAARQVFEQISFHHSKHSAMFDVGILTFSLLVSCQQDEIRWEDPIVREAMRILFEHQSEDGLWHATKPLWAKSGRGLSMTSSQLMSAIVELLANCPELSRIYEPKTRLFIDWLKKNISTVQLASTTLKGWTSELEFSLSRLDIWVTIYVLELSLVYMRVLKDLNREDLLRESGLSVGRKPRPWAEVKPIDLSLPKASRLKERMEQSFVHPWGARSENKGFSMVLYGPPGTSKTRIAEGLADALTTATGSRWVFVTVTPGDFIAGGEQRAEINAATIFQALAEIADAVILFDEIDLLLYDREKLSKKDVSPLQSALGFMTTSMLTKLQSLRDRGRNIFVLTTNRYEDLDRAIRRAGRFDEHFAVLPPDLVSRKELLAEFIGKFDKRNETKFAERVNGSDVSELAEQACLFTYAELGSVVRKALRNLPVDATREILKTNLKQAIVSSEPATNFAYYGEREGAKHETAELLRLLTSGEYQKLSADEQNVCRDLAKALKASPSDFNLVPGWLKKLLPQGN
jgi:ATPase family associated with various cellular activities (AAA)